jgi:hypothetical protein
VGQFGIRRTSAHSYEVVGPDRDSDEIRIMSAASQLRDWALQVLERTPSRAAEARSGDAEAVAELAKVRALLDKVFATFRGGRGGVVRHLVAAVEAAKRENGHLDVALESLAHSAIDPKLVDIDSLETAISKWGTDDGCRALARAVEGTPYRVKWTSLRSGKSDHKTSRIKPTGRGRSKAVSR